MKPKLLLRMAALLAVLAFVGLSAQAQVWLGGQLGNPAHQGFVITNTDNTLNIEAGGNDIWNNSDNGYYYFTWAQGNFDAKVNTRSLINSSTYGGNAWSKVEMMVRWSDPNVGVQGNDAFIASMKAPGQGSGTAAQYRPARNAGAANAGSASMATANPQWLRLTRTNNVFNVLASNDGTTWTTLQTIDVSQTANGFGVPWPNLVTVGVAVTAHDDNNTTANFTTATFDPPTISMSGAPWSPPTVSSITRDVANVNTHVASEASVSFVAKNNATPVSFPMQYQWYKNGAALPGMTGTAITWLATTADNTSQYKCVAWPQGYPSVTVTSAVGTVTVANDSVAWDNGVKLEIFAGRSRAQVEANNTGTGDTGRVSAAGKLVYLAGFEDGGGYGDNTSRRYSTWFTPWANGNYTFYVAGDDDTDVFLSTDADPANKRMVCQELTWSGFNNWIYSEDINSAANIDPTNSWRHAQKCSDTWTNGTGTAPFSAGIGPLTAGTRYYIEVVEHNGGGGDNCSLTAKLFTDPAPTNGQPSTLNSTANNLHMLSYPMPFTPASFVWSIQPSNTSVYEGFSMVLSGSATSDSEFRPNYQWMRFGTNIPGATRTTFGINPVTTANNAEQYQLVATLPTLFNGASGYSSMTSQVATLTVISALFEPGFALEQRWDGVQNVGNAHAGTLGTPTYVAAVPALEASINGETGDNYTRKISTYLVFPVATNVDFYTCSDDPSILYLSTDDNPANTREIARETSWANPFEWTIDAGGANIAYKSSVTWTNNGTTVAPYANGFNLAANKKYYIEVVHSEGGGGDNVETAMVPHNTLPINGNDYAPSGSVIGINAQVCTYVMFTLEPTNPPPVGAGSASSASFYAFGTTDSKLAVGSTRANGPNNTEVANQFVFFQWTKNGQDIPGATGSQLTLTGLRPADNNAQIACRMRALGYGLAPNTRWWSNSTPATLTVTNDPTVPRLLAAGVYQSGTDFSTYLSLTFNAPIDPFTATNLANYTISGTTPYSLAWMSADNRRILIRLNGLPPPPVTVSVTGLASWSGVPLTAASNVTAYQLDGSRFTFMDIGPGDSTLGVQIDPRVPSKLWVEGTNAWTIAATGHDIWDNADGFGFLFETKSGDFDVVMRQTIYGLSSPWAKCGLMAREGIGGLLDSFQFGTDSSKAGQSRNWAVLDDPKDVPTAGGDGANQVEVGYRHSVGTNTSGWWPQGGTYFAFRPQYPNQWIRLKRVGDTLSAFAGVDGTNWWKIGDTTPGANTNNPTPLPTDLFVGIAVTGHNNAPSVDSTEPQYFNYSSVDNYNSSYTGGTVINTSPTVTNVVFSAKVQGGNIVLNWTNPGTVELQWSANLAGWNSFTPHATVPPVTIPIVSTNNVFYRIRPY